MTTELRSIWTFYSMAYFFFFFKVKFSIPPSGPSRKMLILYHQRNDCKKNSHRSCKILNSSSFIIYMKMKYQKVKEILSKQIQHRTTEQRFGKKTNILPKVSTGQVILSSLADERECCTHMV